MTDDPARDPLAQARYLPQNPGIRERRKIADERAPFDDRDVELDVRVRAKPLEKIQKNDRRARPIRRVANEQDTAAP
jgi:hypothetical protein